MEKLNIKINDDALLTSTYEVVWGSSPLFILYLKQAKLIKEKNRM